MHCYVNVEMGYLKIYLGTNMGFKKSASKYTAPWDNEGRGS